MIDDAEARGSWLERLYALNAVVMASGERLAGNICYEHHQVDYERSPPVEVNREKRDRFRAACVGRSRMLEIGVNGGHSAFVALTADPALELHAVDLGDHAYVGPVVDWLQAEFPGRLFFYPGDCLQVLPSLARQGKRFDLFHIDGAKHTYYWDILNCHRLLMRDTERLIIIDDLNMAPVEGVWQRCLREGLVAPAREFPPMDKSAPRRNAIGIVEQISRPRWWQLRTEAWLRRARRQLRWRLEVASGRAPRPS
jgi:predicted O-methyltransferase YrrM